MAGPEEWQELKAQLDAALTTLGASMRDRFAPGLQSALGDTWSKRVLPAQGRFAEFDFASYADCLLGQTERSSHYRALFRQLAGRPWAEYGKALERAKHARNSIGHPQSRFDNAQAGQLIDELAAVALALDLSAAHELSQQAQAVRSGDFSNQNEIQAARAQIRDLGAALEQEREEKAALAEKVREADERMTHQAAEFAMEVQKREQEAELLRRAEVAMASAAIAEHERLETEARGHRKAADDARARARAAQEASRAANAERDQLAQEVRESQERIARLEAEAISLSEEPPTEAPTSHLDPEELQSILREVLADLMEASPIAAREGRRPGLGEPRPSQRAQQGNRHASAATHSVKPGEKWPFGVGAHSYSLRPSSQDIYEYESEVWLSDVVGKPKAREVFKRLARYRPEGGTIRVDSDGDVSTQRKTGGGRFYLGRVGPDEWFPVVIEQAPTASAAVRSTTWSRPNAGSGTTSGPAYHSVQPGDKWPFGVGAHSYSLRPSSQDIYEYESEVWLSDVVGKPKAREVFKRLARYRPEGGTIRVDSDGDVSTQRKTGGGRFYLGRVGPDEWFPDVVGT